MTGRSGTCQCLCVSTYTGVGEEVALPSDANMCSSGNVKCGSSTRCNGLTVVISGTVVTDSTKPNCLVTGTGATPTLGSSSVSCQVN